MEVSVGGTASCTAALHGTAIREARVQVHAQPTLVLNFTNDRYAQIGQTLELDFANDLYGYGVVTTPQWSLPATPCVASGKAIGSAHLWFDVTAQPSVAESIISAASAFCYRPALGRSLAVSDGHGTGTRAVQAYGTVQATAVGSDKARKLAASFGTASGESSGSAFCRRRAEVAVPNTPSLVLNFAAGVFKQEDGTANPWTQPLTAASGYAFAEGRCEKTTESFGFDGSQDIATLELDFVSDHYSTLDPGWLRATSSANAEAFVDNLAAGQCTSSSACTGTAQVSFVGHGQCVPNLGFAPVTAIRTVRMRRQIARGSAAPEGTGYIYVLASGRVEARAHVYGTWREVARGVAVGTAVATGTAGSRIRQAKGNTVADPNEPSLVLDFVRNQYDMVSLQLSGTGALVKGKSTIQARGYGSSSGSSKATGSARHFVAATGLNHVDAAGECTAVGQAFNTLIHTRIVAVARCTAKLSSDTEMTYAGRGKASCAVVISGYAEKVLQAEGKGSVQASAYSTADAVKDASGSGVVTTTAGISGRAKKDASAQGSVSGISKAQSLQTGIGIAASVLGASACKGRSLRQAYVSASTTGVAVQSTAQPVCFLEARGSVSGPFAAKSSCIGETLLVEKIVSGGSVTGIATVTGLNNVNIALVAPSDRVTVIGGSSRTIELPHEDRWLKVA